jgi:circadian clock protein KaiC
VVAAEHRARPDIVPIGSGISELDSLLGGGLTTGTTTAIIGPAGVGKTVLATQYASAMADRGEPAAIYLFDERLNTFVHRTKATGIDVTSLIERNLVSIEQLDPEQVSPGEFATAIRARVENAGARLILIDSLNGYLSAMQDEAAVLVQLHELLTFLNERGVLTILIVAQHGVLGTGMVAPLDVSYLADTLILMRFFEAAGAVRQAISVVKKRTGEHEHTIREFQITSQGPRVGGPIADFQGVMTGVPHYTGRGERLLSAKDARQRNRTQSR